VSKEVRFYLTNGIKYANHDDKFINSSEAAGAGRIAPTYDVQLWIMEQEDVYQLAKADSRGAWRYFLHRYVV
jgi:hypothetical protein